MSVQADFNFFAKVTKTATFGGQQVTVAFESPGPLGSLTETTTPSVVDGWKGSAIAVDGTTEIDLTDLSMAVESGGDSDQLSIDLTGYKILAAKFRTPVGNGSTVTVAEGDSDGYPIGERVLEGNSADGFIRPNNTVAVGPTKKIIKLTSSNPATIEILLVAGE